MTNFNAMALAPELALLIVAGVVLAAIAAR